MPVKESEPQEEVQLEPVQEIQPEISLIRENSNAEPKGPEGPFSFNQPDEP